MSVGEDILEEEDDDEASQSGANCVEVIVTSVHSSNNVHFRFVDYDADFREMTDKMTLRYGNGDNADVAMELKTGRMYATLSGHGWIRVELVARLGNGKVECYFVDEGTTGVLEETALLNLEEDFAALPMQAVQCELDRLWEYATRKDVTKILIDVMLGKSLVAKVIRREDPTTVVMFDTSGPEDVNLNGEIFQWLMTPRLPAKGCMATCYLSCIGRDSVVWLQMNELGLQEVADFLPALNLYCQCNPAIEEQPVMNKIYGCRFPDDGRFYRAMLASPNPLPSGEFDVMFVDYGNREKAFITEFRNIDCFGDLVFHLPGQAVKCRLRGLTEADGITWSYEIGNKVLDLMAANYKLGVKVCEPASGQEPALVELYRQNEHNQDLFSINETVLDFLRSEPPHTPPAVLQPAGGLFGSES